LSDERCALRIPGRTAIIIPMLILNEREVHELLSFEECIAVMEGALSALARGEVHQPLRNIVRAPGAPGFLGLMPAYHASGEAGYGLKAVCVYPDNPSRGLDTHVGAVLLFGQESGELLAVINASAITAIRTAAVSAVATKLLARDDARILTIFGTGAQARAHIPAIAAVRQLVEIRVVGSDVERAETFVTSVQSDIPIRAVGRKEEALDGADIVVTATSSRTPILDAAMVDDGTHINAVGSSVRTTRELDSDLMSTASLYVDWPESTLNESGDFLIAQAEGAIGPEQIRGTIGELLTGKIVGRTSELEITLFKSLGLAIEDHAAANFLYEKAKHDSRGTWLPI
jgi:ornithine cyclodeaminase